MLTWLPVSKASPWLIMFKTLPTINATTAERFGTPSEAHSLQIFVNVDMGLFYNRDGSARLQIAIRNQARNT